LDLRSQELSNYKHASEKFRHWAKYKLSMSPVHNFVPTSVLSIGLTTTALH